MFTGRFGASLKRHNSVEFLKIGSVTTPAVPADFGQQRRWPVCHSPRKAFLGGCGQEQNSAQHSLQFPHGWSIFVRALARL